jgi:flagellar export protein FliJ
MRRFRFRLEAVLRHRETLEGIREQEFGAAQSRLQAEQARMDQLRAEFDHCVAGRPGGSQGEHFDAHAIYDRERYLETLQAAMEQQSRRLEAASLTADEKRMALVTARQAREAVSRLRDQDLAEHTAQGLKQEQDTLDEQATQRFFRATVEAKASPGQVSVPQSGVAQPDSQSPNTNLQPPATNLRRAA